MTDPKPWSDSDLNEMREAASPYTPMRGRWMATVDEMQARIDSLKRVVESQESLLVTSKAFHDLAVKERDFERVKVNRLEGDKEALRAMVDACRELVGEMSEHLDDAYAGQSIDHRLADIIRWRDNLAGVVGYPLDYRMAVKTTDE